MRIRKTTLTFLLGCMTVSTFADIQPLAGFKYGVEKAPTGKEWESPQALSLNKEQPHAWFFSFANTESALKVLPSASEFWKSLDGQWKFNWSPDPSHRPLGFYNPKFDVSGWDNITVPSCWNVVGLQKDGTQKYGTPIYCNQPVIFKHTVAVGDWKGGVMREPNKDWTTYKTRNEVGSYRRTFEVPASWNGRDIYVNFDGVNSFFYLYINGTYVGFSKNSRNTASFNITPYLNKKGENIIAAEVYRSSDGSFLESQDMFRLPGIFRSVSITAKPLVSVADFIARPDLSADYRNGKLNIQAYIKNLSKKALKGCNMTFTLSPCQLYSDKIDPRQKAVVSNSTNIDVQPGETIELTSTPEVSNVNKWSAEIPNRYVLVGQLKDKKGNVLETVSSFVGFRKVEIKNTPASEDEFGLAGRYYYINGMPVKLKGVNRQEINPATGNTITAEQIKNEIMLMKRGNINHVRCSHYSNNPIWYYYCDKYGIYLEDEANIESHEYYYGDASLSHVPEFKDAHVARCMELVHAHVNAPSVVIWSLGNEAGPGKNFTAAYKAIKNFDTTRPVQYERNNDIVDMGSNQYPSIGWTREAVKGKYNMKYPFHISEYAHSMGNAGGNLVDYWNAIESTNFFCGAAIWDWVDQAIYNYTPNGTRYWGYGGDFGDKPNDGMFCMNGILFPDHSPKPEFAEVKKVYQNVGVKAIDMKKGQIEIFNKNYFKPLTDVTIQWSLWKDGKLLSESSSMMGPRVILAPRTKQVYTIPYQYDQLDEKSEYFVKVQFLLAKDEPWAKKGYVQMEEQLEVKAAKNVPAITSVAKGDKLNLTTSKESTIVSGKEFSVELNNNTGVINSLKYNGKEIISNGNGPVISALRAPVDNDNWAYNAWFKNGLHNLKQKIQPGAKITTYVNAEGNVVVSMPIEAQAPCGANISLKAGKYTITEQTNRPFGENDFKFTANQIYTIYKDGSIELETSVTSNNQSLALPRLGYEIQLPTTMGNYTYYGRGPLNNYSDRKTGYFIEQFKSTVKDQFVDFPKPQSMGNREDVRWCALTDNTGNGAQFIANGKMSASALPYSQVELTLAAHPYELQPSSAVHLHLDYAVTGLGGNSCGQGAPLDQDKVKAGTHELSFMIRPINKTTNLTENASVTMAGEQPIGVSRSRAGEVSITSNTKNSIICYQINNGKIQIYSKPFDLRNGGKITVWNKKNAQLKVSAQYAKIETVPMEVIFASSQETGEGNASHLVDGNPNTIWHTMYSVTVANYPHYVDFDAGSTKLIKGFTYLPRQDSENGNIKQYKLQVSQDGKTWSAPVAEGSFERNSKEKRIMLKTPIKARYIRFTGLSSQNGADYAGGAEFSLIAE